MNNIEKTACFSGHRNIPINVYTSLEERLESELTNLIKQGIYNFYAGGAQGFDTLAALTVLKLKKDFHNIRLILTLPCMEQTKYWNEKDKKIYDQILHEADKVVYTSEHYFNGCMHKRNRYLIDNSEICICYLTETSGGTAYTVDYAVKKGLQVINLA